MSTESEELRKTTGISLLYMLDTVHHINFYFLHVDKRKDSLTLPKYLSAIIRFRDTLEHIILLFMTKTDIPLVIHKKEILDLSDRLSRIYHHLKAGKDPQRVVDIVFLEKGIKTLNRFKEARKHITV